MYQATLPLGGYSGYLLLQRTLPQQQQAFADSAITTRELDYFRENISKVTSASELVGDFTLLKVALGAFGLQDDLPNKSFIRKVLDEGATEPQALASRLSDKRYARLSAAFGFDREVPNTGTVGFVDAIARAYVTKQFEVVVGEQREELRLAMAVPEGIATALSAGTGTDTQWYAVMGQAPLRKVFESAFGLPTAFGAIDIDRQLAMLKQKAKALFGDESVRQFADPERLAALTRRFLLQTELDGTAGGTTASSPALAILQGISSGNGILGLLR